MRNLIPLLSLAIAVGTLLFTPPSALAQGTAFAYQGRLVNNSLAANGNYDFTFALFATNNINGIQDGGALTNLDVGVTNGLFTTLLDFGSVFNGSVTWLAVGVRTNGGGSFAALSPLQELTPTPYALYTASAGSASNFTGAVSLAQLPAGVVTNGGANATLTGSFSGNGSQLTNVTADALGTNGNLVPVQLAPVAYPNAGTYSFTIPPDMSQMTVKLWGAGGGFALEYTVSGGGGAFSEVTFPVTPGNTYVLVVGAAGGDSYGEAGGGGGAGSNDGSGGAGGYFVGGGGGQASSLFELAGGEYIMKAVAGGGGGGGIFYVADAGVADGTGAGYSTNATTIGETNLDLMGGDGTSGAENAGGGGGGYGGGLGAASETDFATGGGSYGDVSISGSLNLPGNTNDLNYLTGFGYAGAGGLAVVVFTGSAPVAPLQTFVQAFGFAGDGSQLFDLNATNLTGTISLASLPSSVTMLFSNLDAANLTGTVPLASLPASVAMLDGNQTFTGQNNFAAENFFTANTGIGTTIPDRPLTIQGTGANGEWISLKGTNGATVWHLNNATNGLNFAQTGVSDYRLFLSTNGNVGVGTDNPNGKLTVAGTIVASGTVTANGVLLTSDRNAKENFTTLDGREVLARVASLPLLEWNYKTDASGVRHLGPMAQDFHAAFGLDGNDDKHISVVDEGGVALAAIQGLNQKLAEKDAEIQQLQEKAGQVEALQKELDELKQALQTLARKSGEAGK